MTMGTKKPLPFGLGLFIFPFTQILFAVNQGFIILYGKIKPSAAMKIVLLTLLTTICFAQKKVYTLTDMPFERDSVTGGIVYRGVVEVSGTTANQLYSRAKAFMLKAFTNNTAIIQVDDKESGLLGGKGQRAIPMSMVLLAANDLNQIYYEVPIEIRVKDSKYRYEISNIVLVNRGVRIDLDKEFKKRPNAYDNMSEKQYQRYLSKDPVNDLVSELKTAMSKPDPKDF